MIKETFTDKLIKRFYGITGPLDEQKRQQVDRMGNIAFVVLFFTLLCGNCIAFLIGFKYPELVARIYPSLLLIIILLVSSILTYKLKISAVNAFDEEELTEKEKKQLKHVGLKSGLYFGISMFLGMPLVHFLVDNKDYLTELFSIHNMLSGIFEAILLGLSCRAWSMLVSNKPNLKLRKVTNKLKDKEKSRFPSLDFSLERIF
ncbi:MAG: DUF3278 domain-containing protein [Streptococcus sp.]